MAKKPIEVETLTHDATRKNIPTAEFESIMREQDKTPIQLAYARRNADLDPQLVWRGKDMEDWSDLIVQAPPLYIQEKVHPKVLIDDLKRQTKSRTDAQATKAAPQFDMFADFNGLPDAEAATEFYQHDQHWSNRMISGDSLSVMASLAEREGLRGQVQCIYFDPPYGIKFNSNFQWSTTSRDVKDGDKTHVTREPEQVRAFRDTWKDGIHSYLTYLRDRLTVARDLLSDSGSIFVQIGDENVHRVRALMDEVLGDENCVSQITFVKTSGQTSGELANISDYILWYARSKERMKFRQPFIVKAVGGDGAGAYTRVREADLSIRSIAKSEKDNIETLPVGARVFRVSDLTSPKPPGSFPVNFLGKVATPGKGYWKTHETGIGRLIKSARVFPTDTKIYYSRFIDDFSVYSHSNNWTDTVIAGFASDKRYIVETSTKVVERCIVMATDPGDLVLDPTCGSGTTAYVAEQWGRRWITIDTSRVAVALARSRLMGARYPYYLLADSPEGQRKEAEITRTLPKTAATYGSIRQGFVYDRVPHITLKSIANNAEIDVIWERMQPAVETAIDDLNTALRGHGTPFKVEQGGRAGAKIDFTASGEVKLPSGDMAPANGFMEWEIPREALSGWPVNAQQALKLFWDARIARQREIDASIAAKADYEYLYDKPYTDTSKVRVAGPFTVESLSPHRTLTMDWNDELVDLHEAAEGKRKAAERDDRAEDFAQMILENLKAAGVQQAHKEDRLSFTALTGWPGHYLCAEGQFMEGDRQRRAGIFIGPEFGTVSRPDLVAAAREAGEAGFDVLIACAFNYDAHSAEFDKLGRVPVLKARMNPDLHMGGDLKSTGAGNLFVIFGEPDIRHVVGKTPECASEIARRLKCNSAIAETLASLSGSKDEGAKEALARQKTEQAKNIRFIEAAEALPDGQVLVEISGVDVFKPQTGEVQSEGTDGIALWMLDTDYNEESFFVRHAYFLGANDPYKALKTSLKAEIDEDAWESLYSDISRPFPKPKSGRIAVKVINHLGDEVMKVFAVE
ncbi:site-specific DNA-methyltransferase (plasmid) [Gemmobacter fulvus]|uniref:site-specific DNA-methyltransferase (adenine-specific) n=1 Tax=Gemmobacter fulvus TaxID=2840474 RepID=A0A975PCN1_9RHOB|nr:site-specific DNA-methyltransferase [Gemmobacter fulvus]QWK93258.1 site-specific DNA-methyltransferase [Gemmobacter fulvus]